MEPRAPRVHPQQALAVYVEPLAAGRRVVVFADPSTGLLERLEELEADAVVLVGPDDDLDELRGARFEVALVADLAIFPDPAELVGRVRRLVGESGVAVIAAANREAGAPGARALDYYALFDLVAGEFAEVRMVAELPFHGVALAEVGEQDEAPSVSVDTQLADGDRTPVAFVAVASQRGAALDPYTIVELPAPEPAPARVEVESDAHRRQLEEARAAVAEERLRSQTLAAQLETAARHAARASDLEHELAARARQLAELSSEVEEMRSAAEAGRIAAAQVEQLALRADRAERALAHVEPELAKVAKTHADELAAYEHALRDRAQAIRALEAEVVRREALVRELVGALEEHALQPPPPLAVEAATEPRDRDGAVAALTEENAQLRRKLDELALDLARREGEAQAAAWTVAELERRVAHVAAAVPGKAAPPEAPGAAEAERKLAAALDELDALRRAMAQEHEARVRAESGEELVRARAEIQRQAALIEQLGRSLAAKPGQAEELR